jgi:hypothetical protein
MPRENLGKCSAMKRSMQRVACFTYLLLLNGFFGLVVWYMMREVGNSYLTAITVSVIAQIAPWLIRMNVDIVEVHVSSSHRQWSLMVQMFIFLACNAAVNIYLARDPRTSLHEKTLKQVADVLFFNSIIGPLRKFFQPVVYLRRRLQAPFCANFAKMKSFFGPTDIDLG